ncbi:hypothetical protein ABK040_014555 [Willaertia magna]
MSTNQQEEVVPVDELFQPTSTTTIMNNENSSPNSNDSSPNDSSPINTTTSSSSNIIIPPITINDTLSTSSSSSPNNNNIEPKRKLRSERRLQKVRTPRERVEPIQSEVIKNDWLLGAYSEMQGRRSTMEDALYFNLSFRKDSDSPNPDIETFIGIYDGHGGSNSSKMVAEQLHSIFIDKLYQLNQFLEMSNYLKENLNHYSSLEKTNSEDEHLIEMCIKKSNTFCKYLNDHFREKEKNKEYSIEPINIYELPSREIIPILLRETFLETNDFICKQNDRDGTTASVIYFPNKEIAYIANVGDSRIVLYRNNNIIKNGNVDIQYNILKLTMDHRPNEIDERRRVRDAGGNIYGNRVNACLAVTRAIGDKSLHPYITSDPYTCTIDLNEKDQFLIIACDGLWDFISEEECCMKIKDIYCPLKASLLLRDLAFERGSTDNISVIVVRFKQSIPKEELEKLNNHTTTVNNNTTVNNHTTTMNINKNEDGNVDTSI